jgi:putative tricarboxylic transport membrane protein
MVLALVLGDRAEDAFRQTMLGARGDLTVFWSNGLVGTITTLALLMLVWPLLTSGINSATSALRARPA